MSFYLILLIFLLVLTGGGMALIAFLRGRIQKKIIAFGNKYELETSFEKNKYFKMQGEYRSYPIDIQPIKFEQYEHPQLWTSFMVEMTNPNKKYISIHKNIPNIQLILDMNISSMTVVKHDLAADILIFTDDLWFSSIVLGKNVTEKLQSLFSQFNAGFFYIKDEELFAMLPLHPVQEGDWPAMQMVMDILVEIKQQLK